MPPEAAAELTPATTTEPLTITLSPELSERIRLDIALHGYATPLAVVEEAFHAFDETCPELEPWMEQEILEACEEYDRDPTNVRTMEQIKQMLAAEYERAVKEGL